MLHGILVLQHNIVCAADCSVHSFVQPIPDSSDKSMPSFLRAILLLQMLGCTATAGQHHGSVETVEPHDMLFFKSSFTSTLQIAEYKVCEGQWCTVLSVGAYTEEVHS